MGFLDRLLGREEQPSPEQRQPQGYGAQAGYGSPAGAPAQRSDDEIAVERYRYLLRTAPPETIEQVHEEAFSKLTPEQRQLLFQQLSANAPAGEQPRADDARSLAQSATRSELRQPGTLERSLGAGGGAGFGGRGGPGLGGMFASSLLGSVAGYVIGSAIVSSFLPPVDQQAGDGGSADGSGDGGSGDGGSGDGGSGDNGSGDGGSGDGGGDAGSSDAGGWGGDAGAVSADGGGWGSGGDGGFGGGDFGGGDFGGGGDFF